ncbi:oxidoreductase FAD-binding protein [Diplocarpon rosae]|nr:oxidoreductase FAD-binding protein [Diplocarpon rosae]
MRKVFVVNLAIISFVQVITADPTSKGPISRCCSALSSLAPSLYFPGSALYINQSTGLESSAGYWSSLESELLPACRLTPTNIDDLAMGVRILSSKNCHFAIRSGGHMTWKGAANYDGNGKEGVTIDMSSMDTVQVLNSWSQTGVSRNERVAKIETGARWRDVYAKMDPQELAVPGGRVNIVGVGGFLTGGGMHFFAHAVGFACNSVLQYEVVLGNGTVVIADSQENPDLWFALKGGNNNFGIVASFTMKTIPIPNGLWGGFIISPISAADQTLEAFYEFGETAGRGGDASGSSVSILFAEPPNGTSFISTFIISADGAVSPSILSNITALPESSNTLRKSTLGAFTAELASGYHAGKRELFGMATFINNLEMLKLSKQMFNEIFSAFDHVKGYERFYIIQPINRAILASNEKMGGNNLGLSPNDGNLVWGTAVISWEDPSFDNPIHAASRNFIAAINRAAKHRGLFHPYIYLNYALASQDPISSYGTANVQKLQNVSAKYDPEQVFQRLVPGGFKLPKGGF